VEVLEAMVLLVIPLNVAKVEVVEALTLEEQAGQEAMVVFPEAVEAGAVAEQQVALLATVLPELLEFFVGKGNKNT
jgi:hypothetical protein